MDGLFLDPPLTRGGQGCPLALSSLFLAAAGGELSKENKDAGTPRAPAKG
jgi:hypothetical protein